MSETTRVHALTPKGLFPDASAQFRTVKDGEMLRLMLIYLQQVTDSKQTHIVALNLRKCMLKQGELVLPNIITVRGARRSETHIHKQHSPNMQT